jgi:sRNA-binding protein
MDPIGEYPRSGRGQGTAVCSDGRDRITTATLQDSPNPTPAAALLTRLSAELSVLGEYRPLAIGIDLAMCDAARHASDKQRCQALALHCGSQRYLEAVAAGGARYALDSTACGEVTELQREAAKARLEVIAKAALRKAARAKRCRQARGTRRHQRKYNARPRTWA